MELLEVPYPALKAKNVLVRVHHSVISSGTEGRTVKDARANYVQKALSRKEEVKKVVEAARTHGIKDTYNMVKTKLNAPSSLGYSCAGTVVAIGDQIRNFKVGDQVSCAGASAAHAEVVSIPSLLCAKIPDGVSTDQAAFTTIGAIAMQGIRQADLRLGEHAVVIGLGLIGQITIQLLKAAGVQAVGIDLDPWKVGMAERCGADLALLRNEPGLEKIIQDNSGGAGTDAVIITAGTSSNDPIDLAGTLCRQKGKVVIVGNVPTGFQRKIWYKKELELRMSTSYGPGRYDADYEEKGIDYPIGHVRWTENRNMQSFLDLLATKKVNLEPLITHRYTFDKAPEAYEMLMAGEEQPAGRAGGHLGIVLEYDLEKELKQRVELKPTSGKASKGVVGMLGAGSFARNFLLPTLSTEATLQSVVTSRPNNARYVADKFGFANCPASADELLDDPSIDTIFIATRHDSHAKYVLIALNKGKHVFVEKPLCLTLEELEQITAAKPDDVHLMVGFNRRFSPMVQKIKSLFRDDRPKAINYRINTGVLPADHWVHDPLVGGGRIIGEACHFIDLCLFLAGAPITKMKAEFMGEERDTANILLRFENGSTANISYFSNGNKKLDKERLEVFCDGSSAVIDDFKTLTIFGEKVIKQKGKQDKGHAEQVRQFMAMIKNGGAPLIDVNEILDVSRRAIELATNRK